MSYSLRSPSKIPFFARVGLSATCLGPDDDAHFSRRCHAKARFGLLRLSTRKIVTDRWTSTKNVHSKWDGRRCDPRRTIFACTASIRTSWAGSSTLARRCAGWVKIMPPLCEFAVERYSGSVCIDRVFDGGGEREIPLFGLPSLAKSLDGFSGRVDDELFR